MLKVFCYGDTTSCNATTTELDSPSKWVCDECLPLMCLNDSCYSFMNEEGVICESCSEYGYVSEGKYVLHEDEYEMSDVEADADTLVSAGYGTDEDYGYYGD